jgi:hypothetical protein
MPKLTYDVIRKRAAIAANRRNVHPSVEAQDTVLPPTVTLPKPPGNELFWRLNEVILLDNFDGFFDRRNEVQVVAVTIDSNVADPIQFSTPHSFVGIKKNDRLPLGDAGIGMYQSSPASFPKYLHLNLLIVEDDAGTRELGTAINRVRETEEYATILETTKALVAVGNPAYSSLLGLGDTVVGLLAKMLEQNQDDIIAFFAGTYSLAFDNLGVGRHTFHQNERARVQYEILAQT